MRILDDILETLSDGQEHFFEEIRFKASRNLTEAQVKLALRFLQSYGFLNLKCVDGADISAQLNSSMLTFLEKIKRCE